MMAHSDLEFCLIPYIVQKKWIVTENIPACSKNRLPKRTVNNRTPEQQFKTSNRKIYSHSHLKVYPIQR